MIEKNDNSTPDRSKRPLSPCILICTLDDEKNCLGCGRTLEQISRWALMSRDEQWAVVDELAQRECVN
ncbi:MAG: DUF1289 domain-containing protein [Woeseiaceae bacterium]